VTMDNRDSFPRLIKRLIPTPTACARNVASSASSVILTPPPLQRSACTRFSIAARRQPASSPLMASDFIPSAGLVSSATPLPAVR
jgi:hypothetical protein